jgi:Tfp pilus assembly protein PilO
MQNLSLVKSIFFLLTASIIGYFFIIPQVSNIRLNQDQKSVFDAEVNRIAGVTQSLLQFQSAIASTPVADRQKLIRFLPAELDDLLIMRDIEALLTTNNLTLKDIEAQPKDESFFDEVAIEGEVLSLPAANTGVSLFEVTFQGTYTSIKNFLLFSEQHPYIIELREVKIEPLESTAVLEVEAVIAVYYYKSQFSVTNN